MEFIAYSEFIRKEFAIERRHTWQLQPTGKKVKSPDGANRYFMVSVDCPEMSQLSVAHKQFTVNYHLKNIGKVIQLEHNLFGVPDHYLAVFCGTEKLNVEEVQLKCTLVEVSPQTFPDAWLPTYGVDDFGFYTVSGTFPSKLSPQLREKFAADMKTAGAVGFRNNQSEEFTLHFVNSRCLEQIGKFSQYSSFNLKIHSSLVKKASLKNKIKKLVPAILKLKVVKGKVNGDVSVEAPTHANESNKVVKEAPKERVQSITDIKPNEDKKMESKSKPRKDQELPQTETAAGNNLEPRKGALNSEVDKKDCVIITENDLLKVNWNPGYSLAKSSQTFGKFLHSLGEYQVTNSKEGEITFRIKDRRHFIKELKFFSRNETNSLDKLSKAEDQRRALAVVRVSRGAEHLFQQVFGFGFDGRESGRADIRSVRYEVNFVASVLHLGHAVRGYVFHGNSEEVVDLLLHAARQGERDDGDLVGKISTLLRGADLVFGRVLYDDQLHR